MSKIKNGGLDQYGAGPSEQQQFGTAGVEGVNDVLVADRIIGHILLVGGANDVIDRGFTSCA